MFFSTSSAILEISRITVLRTARHLSSNPSSFLKINFNIILPSKTRFPHCVVFSSLLLLPSSKIKITSSESHHWTSYTYILFLIYETNFHTHIHECVTTEKVRVLCTVELHFSGCWIFTLPIIRIGLALRVNLSRILQNQLSLKLPVIGSSTVQCYGF